MASDPISSLPSLEQPAPLGGTRSQAMQRLQVGGFGLAAMLLLVGLANIIMHNARQNQAQALPQASPSASLQSRAGAVSDPLADAGVVPDMPAASSVPRSAGSAQPGAR